MNKIQSYLCCNYIYHTIIREKYLSISDVSCIHYWNVQLFISSNQNLKITSPKDSCEVTDLRELGTAENVDNSPF